MLDSSKIVFNLSTETISLLFMIILLIACIIQKRRSHASNLFINVIILEVLILTVQIIQWVLWAVENGIAKGITATTFEPKTTCTRGQSVTFLYRMYSVI